MIPFVRSFEFEYGRVDRVSPLIRRVVANNPGPFTFTGTGTYIIGRGAVAVIDPGPALPDHLDALLEAVSCEQVTHILVTHTHADHSPLARPLAEAVGAPILAARPPADEGHDGVEVEEALDAAFRPDVLLSDGERFEGPGWTLETIATPGHASNHLAFALLEENALFSGDHVMGWSTTVVAPPDGDMGAYYDSLDRITARGFSTLWPTHGPPVRKVAPFLEAYKAHRLAREAQIQACLAQGARSLPMIVAEVYATVAKSLWPAASLSTFAHLTLMHRQGRIEADPDLAPDAVFRLAGARVSERL